MKTDVVETILGAVVLVVAFGFLYYATTQTNDAGSGNAYSLTAKFDRVDGVSTGSDVRMSGIKIGTVTDQVLDPDTYSAVITMSVDNSIQVPDDSSVKISSDGLLGGAYLNIEPGGSPVMLADGEEVLYSQGAVDLFGLIGQAITAVGGSGN